MKIENKIFDKSWINLIEFFNETKTYQDLIIKSFGDKEMLFTPLVESLKISILNDDKTDEYYKPVPDGMNFLVTKKNGKHDSIVTLAMESGKLFYKNIKVFDNEDHLQEKDKRHFLKNWARTTVGLDLVEDLNQNTDQVDAAFSPNKMILTAGPSISSMENFYSFDAAKNGWNSQWSKYLTKFESDFTDYIGAKYALATSSCTGALQIALMSLDIGEGDEVIVPDLTWVATANAVRYVGATPIFADVELDSWNLDAKSVESLITKNTKAIMPVHMYGHPARMSNIVKIANEYNLRIIEDAAPAIGAKWEEKNCGTFGDFAGFSFQGAKLLVTGEGGMLVTNNEDLYIKAKKIWDQGRNPSKVFWIDADGVKFKMSNVQAALGLGQIHRADELIEMKRRIFSWYEEGLSENKYVTLNKEVSGARSIYWMSSIFLSDQAGLSRNELMLHLKNNNVDTRPVFPAISKYPIWNKAQKPKTNASKIGEQAMNLPSGVCLTKDEVMYVCRQINQALGK